MDRNHRWPPDNGNRYENYIGQHCTTLIMLERDEMILFEGTHIFQTCTLRFSIYHRILSSFIAKTLTQQIPTLHKLKNRKEGPCFLASR